MNLGAIRFGLSTQFNVQQTKPAVQTNLALLDAQDTVDEALKAIKDDVDPIKVEIYVDGEGKANAEIKSTFTKQTGSAVLEERTKAGEFWQSILTQVQGMVPNLKSLLDVQKGRIAEVASQVSAIQTAMEQNEFIVGEKRKDRGFGGDYAASETVELAVAGAKYFVTYKATGALTFHIQETGQSFSYYPAPYDEVGPTLNCRRDREEAGYNFNVDKREPHGCDADVYAVEGQIKKLVQTMKEKNILG